jgi:hypothetical protein
MFHFFRLYGPAIKVVLGLPQLRLAIVSTALRLTRWMDG